MPDINLNIPSNSRFHSSLNEIDLAMRQALLHVMRIADPRDFTREQDNTTSKEEDYLWNESRVFQVDELETNEIFNTYLLRKKINKDKGVDVSYPLLGFMQKDIETVFWGTGNRYHQWYLDIPASPDQVEKGDNVVIAEKGKYFGLKGAIGDSKTTINNIASYSVIVNGKPIVETNKFTHKNEIKYFAVDDLRFIDPDKIPQRYKAKAITGTYMAVVLCDTKDEAQYLRDKFILRCSDAKIWWKYRSPTIKDNENQLFTVFGIPNLERYPGSDDKLKNTGYIYGIAFEINYWGCLTDEPLPNGYIETIRMNMHVENVDGVNRIVIN